MKIKLIYHIGLKEEKSKFVGNSYEWEQNVIHSETCKSFNFGRVYTYFQDDDIDDNFELLVINLGKRYFNDNDLILTLFMQQIDIFEVEGELFILNGKYIHNDSYKREYQIKEDIDKLSKKGVKK